jgi:hypothetical protein
MLTFNTKQSFAVLIIGLLLSAGVSAEDDPHWNKGTCQACHVDAAPVAGNISLHEGDAEALCDTCHGDRGAAVSCRHSSDIAVDAQGVGENFRASLKDGKLACTTCHDIAYQCENPSVQFSFHNPGFLRDRTSRETGDYCFQCHEKSGYEKLNPHAGVAGSPPRPTCLLCHKSFPETNAAGQLAVEFNMQHDLNDTCRGCHVVRPHPSSMSFGGSQSTDEWVHFVVPSAEVLKHMKKAQAETGIGLPLNPQNGEVFCATCHNPHDFKLGGEHGLEEQVARYRLRINNICQACHDK